jgi:CRISPR-associated exonuclease Cas4
MDIKNTLLSGLQKFANQHTLTTLGDRNSYLGASDIGYCPRKVILDRLHPAEHDLATLLRFQRGHMAEDIVANAMTAAGYTNFDRQVEAIAGGNTPIRCHIDFVFNAPNLKAVLEVKSVSGIPNGPYSSWESQLYMQMGALKEKYPNHQIKGAVLAIDLGSGDIGFFNGYAPDEILYKGLKDRAASIWTDYQFMMLGHPKNPPTEPSPLCGYCNNLPTCPRFAAKEVPDLEDCVTELRSLLEQGKVLSKQIEPMKARLLSIVSQAGHAIKVNNTILSKAVRSRQHTDIGRLTAFLAEMGHSMEEFQESSSYSFLDIKTAKMTIPRNQKAA